MLDELRKKPRAVRTLYAFWGAIGITAVIAFFWAISLVIRLDSIDTKPIEGVGEATGAFSQFIQKTKDKFFNNHSTKTEELETDKVAPVSSSTAATSTPKSNAETRATVTPLIATTTPQKVQIGTSSTVAN